LTIHDREELVSDDRYFDLDALSDHTGLSRRTLQRYIDDPENPLPSHHVHPSNKERGRVLVSKREFDAWVAGFPPRLAESKQIPKPKPAKASAWDRKLAKLR
jgi:hypothetical protein